VQGLFLCTLLNSECKTSPILIFPATLKQSIQVSLAVVQVAAVRLKREKAAGIKRIEQEQESLRAKAREVDAKIEGAKADYAQLLQQQLESLHSL